MHSTQYSEFSLMLADFQKFPARYFAGIKACHSSFKRLPTTPVFLIAYGLLLTGCTSSIPKTTSIEPPSAEAGAPVKHQPSGEKAAEPSRPNQPAHELPSANQESSKKDGTGEPDSNNDKSADKAGKSKRANLTPYTTWENVQSLVIGNTDDFSDAYTRLIVTSDLAADGKPSGEKNLLEDYPYDPRSWLSRWVVGSEFSINFTAKFTVGTFEETIPLVTVGHQSNSDGEKWDRIVYHSSKNHPLFLVRRDGHSATPAVRVTMHGSRSYTSRGASSALQVAIGVADAVAPTSSVVTRLSEQTAKDHSRALDSAISKLFGTDITEEHISTPDLYSWAVGKDGMPVGINIELKIPDDEKWDGKNRKSVGTWTITFDHPRPSIFSDWRICRKEIKQTRCTTADEARKNVRKEVDASEVLSYPLLNEGQSLGTIRAYLAQQDWFNQAQTAMVVAKKESGNAKSQKVADLAGQMCRRIRNTITGLNLNGFDADIVVWAVMKGMPWPDGAPLFDELTRVGDCHSATQPIETVRPKPVAERD